jgi:hypothetical protein
MHAETVDLLGMHGYKPDEHWVNVAEEVLRLRNERCIYMQPIGAGRLWYLFTGPVPIRAKVILATPQGCEFPVDMFDREDVGIIVVANPIQQFLMLFVRRISQRIE